MAKQDTTEYDLLFQKYQTPSIPWKLLKAQVKAESGFKPNAVSPVGAKGLGQFMDATWKEWGLKRDVFNPEANISAQARYMDFLFKFHKKLLPEASEFKLHWTLAAYNYGLGNTKKLITNGSPHYPTVENCLPKETRDYVAKIMKFYNEYGVA